MSDELGANLPCRYLFKYSAIDAACNAPGWHAAAALPTACPAPTTPHPLRSVSEPHCAEDATDWYELVVEVSSGGATTQREVAAPDLRIVDAVGGDTPALVSAQTSNGNAAGACASDSDGSVTGARPFLACSRPGVGAPWIDHDPSTNEFTVCGMCFNAG